MARRKVSRFWSMFSTTTPGKYLTRGLKEKVRKRVFISGVLKRHAAYCNEKSMKSAKSSMTHSGMEANTFGTSSAGRGMQDAISD